MRLSRESIAALASAMLCLVVLGLSGQTAPSLPLSSGGGGSSSAAASCAGDPTCVLRDGSRSFTGAVEMSAGAHVAGAYSSGVALSVTGGNSVKVTGGGGVVVDNGVFGTSTMAVSGFTGERFTLGNAQYCTATNDNGSGAWVSFGDRAALSSPYVGAPAYTGVFSVTSNRTGVYGKTAGILIHGWGAAEGYGVVDLSGSSSAASAAEYPISGNILGAVRWGQVPKGLPSSAAMWCQAGETWDVSQRGTQCFLKTTQTAHTISHTMMKWGMDGSQTQYLDSSALVSAPATFQSYQWGAPAAEAEIASVATEDPSLYAAPNAVGSFASVNLGLANRHISNTPDDLPSCTAFIAGRMEYWQDTNAPSASLCLCAMDAVGGFAWRIISGIQCPDGLTTGITSLTPVTARSSRASNLSVFDVTETPIPMTTEDFDTANMWDGGATTKLTAPRSDYYLIGAGVAWDNASGTGARGYGIRLNGATYIAYHNDAAVTAAALESSLTASYYLTAGDYVEVVAYQNSGGTISVLSTAGNPNLWMKVQ